MFSEWFVSAGSTYAGICNYTEISISNEVPKRGDRRVLGLNSSEWMLSLELMLQPYQGGVFFNLWIPLPFIRRWLKAGCPPRPSFHCDINSVYGEQSLIKWSEHTTIKKVFLSVLLQGVGICESLLIFLSPEMFFCSAPFVSENLYCDGP